jgi:cell wall assembly regulator SMI1
VTERTVTTPQGVTLLLDKELVDDARIRAFEARLGATLPDEYRAFLLAYNGGQPTPSEFRLAGRTGPYTDSQVHWFYSLHEGPYSNLEKTRALLGGRLPDDLLAIAGDPGGNKICIGLAGDARGRIMFFDHETDRVELVADSLDAFLRGLTST